jgi:hypothetical protein
MIEKTAASLFDGGRQIRRGHAWRKFREATLDDKPIMMSRCRDVIVS